MRLAWPLDIAQGSCTDDTELDADELFLDAVDAVVLAALERVGFDPRARFRLVRRLSAAAQEAATNRHLS